MLSTRVVSQGRARAGDGQSMDGARDVIGKHDRYPRALLAAFTVIWAAMAIAPWYRQD